MFVKMYNYYNLRFGYCNIESEGDFIDNIVGALNICIANGNVDNKNDYLLVYQNDTFSAFKGNSMHEIFDKLAESLSKSFGNKIAKGLIKSAYECDPDGIIDHVQDYEDRYFDIQEDDNVYGFIPCYFAVSSVTYECESTVNIKSGEIIHKGEKIDNLSDFFGYLDEDDRYAIGIRDCNNN